MPSLHLTRGPHPELTATSAFSGLHLTKVKPVIITKHPIITTMLAKTKDSVKADNNCAVLRQSDF